MAIPETPIEISIRGKVSYEDAITVAQAAQIISYLNAPERGGTSPGLLHGVGAQGEGGLNSEKAVGSPREALDLSGATTNPEKIVALGQYVLGDGGETFKVEDVKAQFRRARETAPANFSRDLSVAVQAGWIAPGDGDEYYITNKIRGIFDGDFKFPKPVNGGRVKARTTTKSAKSRSGKPEVFSEIDEFQTRLDGFPPYVRMKTNKDKILWALQFSKVHGIKGLTNKDVAWVTDQFGAGVPSRQIAAALSQAKVDGYMNRSTQDETIRITEDGEEYLKTADSSKS